MPARSWSHATRETSLASLVRSPSLRPDVVLAAPQPLLLDADWAQVLDEARQEAYQEGHDAGVTDGAQRIRELTRELGDALDAAVAAVQVQIEVVKSEWSARLLNSAVDLAEQLVGGTAPNREMLMSRLEKALADLDSPLLEVSVCPDDLETVAAALDDSRTRVVADPSLAPGEARIVGDWCDADLTWKTMFDVVRGSIDD